jgi:hypothetical protein
MSPNELQRATRRRAFLPFRMHLTNGKTFDVYHPELIMVGVRTTALGIPASGDPELWDRMIEIDNLHITHLEPLPQPISTPPNVNGHA